MFYLICIILGIFIEQEYSSYVPNIKFLYLHILEYLKENNKKEIEKKDIPDNINNYMFNFTTYLSSLYGYVPETVSNSISYLIPNILKPKND